MHTNGDYTHEFHPYPAKFPPAIARELIQRLSTVDDIVFDPFCGSGTTLVEARLEHRNAVGIELNPIGSLISKAKSLYYSDEDLKALQKFVLDFKVHELFKLSVANGCSDTDFPNRSHWFSTQATKELATLKHLILTHPLASTNVGLLLKTAFSRIIVPMSYQDTETRYARVERQHAPGATFVLFLKTCTYYLKQLFHSERRPHPRNRTEVYEGNIEDQMPRIATDSVDFLLTSPPYINSFDYYLYHKQRMHWLGYDPRKIRAVEIGNHHRIDTKTYHAAVSEYRDCMTFFMTEAYRTLKQGAHAAVLIGDGIVKNNVVAADRMMEEIANDIGFTRVSKTTLDLAKVSKTFIKEHDRISRKKHHVLIFQKS